eukprot:1149137-Pelagomonas_calceolata.AAC.2
MPPGYQTLLCGPSCSQAPGSGPGCWPTPQCRPGAWPPLRVIWITHTACERMYVCVCAACGQVLGLQGAHASDKFTHAGRSISLPTWLATVRTYAPGCLIQPSANCANVVLGSLHPPALIWQ